MMNQLEEWRPIKDAPGYEVSNHGRVRSVARVVRTTNGQARRYKGCIFSPCKTVRGHLKVLLGIGGGRKLVRYVHQLVAEAFIGPRPKGKEVAHRDGNPANNRKENLRYATPKENAADKIAHGTHLEGERHPGARLTAREVQAIRGQLRRGVRQRTVAEWFGVSRSTIASIAQGRSWRCSSDVTGGPAFIGAPEREPA